MHLMPYFNFRMVLKGIPSVLSPDLLHVLASMGHGDKIVLADTNFPSSSICMGEGAPRLIRADGHTIPQLLEAILHLLPLDTYVFAPVTMRFLICIPLNIKKACLMDLVNKDKNSGMESPPVWPVYQQLLDKAEGRKVEMTKLER